jgi:hypothetical protein
MFKIFTSLSPNYLNLIKSEVILHPFFWDGGIKNV